MAVLKLFQIGSDYENLRLRYFFPDGNSHCVALPVVWWCVSVSVCEDNLVGKRNMKENKFLSEMC